MVPASAFTFSSSSLLPASLILGFSASMETVFDAGVEGASLTIDGPGSDASSDLNDSTQSLTSAGVVIAFELYSVV